MVSGEAHFPVWQMPQRESEQGVTIHMLKMVLGNRKLRIASMIDPNDNRFPYVLLCSTFGTIVSLASVWLEIYHAFAPVVGA